MSIIGKAVPKTKNKLKNKKGNSKISFVMKK